MENILCQDSTKTMPFGQELEAVFNRQYLQLELQNRELKLALLSRDLECANKEIEILSSYIDYLEGRRHA